MGPGPVDASRQALARAKMTIDGHGREMIIERLS
jgi:hypothetical protein